MAEFPLAPFPLAPFPLAMFPLGTVLFPYAYLPLHVFELRYRTLVEHCLAGEREFGVVLIERGSEVGGGDVRTDLGTVARIVQAAPLPDGRWLLGTVGTRRIRVAEWLPEDPYPRAQVVELADTPVSTDLAGLRTGVEQRLRRTLALRTELGEGGPPSTIELDADPRVASYQAAALAPIGPADGQLLLSHDDAGARLEALAQLLDDVAEQLTFRLSGT